MKQQVALCVSGISLLVIATTGFGNDVILRKAIVYNDFAAISNYVCNGGEINRAEGSKNQTALHIAAGENRLKIAQFLIEHQADINARDNMGLTPLHWAAYNGNLDMVAYMLQHNANINAADIHGLTPLHLAVQYGHRDVINLLLDAGADLNARTYEQGLAPIHWSAFWGYPEGLKELLAHGADINMRDSTGDTALTWAEAFYHENMARLIARKGGKRNIN